MKGRGGSEMEGMRVGGEGREGRREVGRKAGRQGGREGVVWVGDEERKRR